MCHDFGDWQGMDLPDTPPGVHTHVTHTGAGSASYRTRCCASVAKGSPWAHAALLPLPSLLQVTITI